MDIDSLLLAHGLGGGAGQNVGEGIVARLQVAPGETVTAGDVVEYINGKVRKTKAEFTKDGVSALNFEVGKNIQAVGACKLDENRAFIAYKIQDGTNALWSAAALIMTIDDAGNMSVGSPVVFEAAHTNQDPKHMTPVLVDKDKVLLVYVLRYNNLFTHQVRSVVVSTANNVITFGTITSPPYGWQNNDKVMADLLETNKAIVAWRDGSNGTELRFSIATVSGMTVTYTQAWSMTGVEGYRACLLVLSPTRVFVAYNNSSSPYTLYARLLTVNGSTIDSLNNSIVSIGFYEASHCYAAKSGPDRICLVTALPHTTATGGYAHSLSVAGDVITYHTTRAMIGQLAGIGLKVTFLKQDGNGTDYYAATYVNTNLDFINFQRIAISSTNEITFPTGFWVDGRQEFATDTFSPLLFEKQGRLVMPFGSYKAGFYMGLLRGYKVRGLGSKGIALNGGTAGQTIKMGIRGVSKAPGSLAAGNHQYVDDNGNVTATDVNHKVGLAVASNQMIIQFPFWESRITGDSTDVVVSPGGTITQGRVVKILPNGSVVDLIVAGAGINFGVAQPGGKILARGISRGHTGLRPGENYYYSTTTGVISQEQSGVFVGIAISPTELLIPKTLF
ncbi:hypothetical protein [Brevibacillus brevis]|uniref:hypothetical protein n=1 Tax=Brevibacillus brevis TaxID=1393 RepID=UPI000D0F57B0|nr:hypothetical protein [Brevibacillus brevis]PSJ69442.1 hypothetical protein C7J99_09850 [Brevibacillus brevis]RED21232.1 hypothetical protein DES34_12270 [Brevibacillus brevis]GEC93500.1 hypothetical protein BBR01nite_58310 [Brevibacillus brevis]VEF90133.1 Uncharacterised protein [Brevibacillus brevis]